MELDLTTFVLEVVNFLVLVWLLARFLYRPVKVALDARTEATARLGRDLESRRAALDAMAADLDAQRQALEARRDSAERELAGEMAVQRQKLLAALNRELDAEREKARVRLEQDEARTRQKEDRELRERAADFVAAYLKRLASPSVEAAVIELFLSDLAEQSEQARVALRAGSTPHREGGPMVDVSTAYAPPADLRERVQTQLNALIGQATAMEWRIDRALLAGICVHLPGHSLEASLRRGVDAFAAGAA